MNPLQAERVEKCAIVADVVLHRLHCRGVGRLAESGVVGQQYAKSGQPLARKLKSVEGSAAVQIDHVWPGSRDISCRPNAADRHFEPIETGGAVRPHAALWLATPASARLRPVCSARSNASGARDPRLVDGIPRSRPADA